MFKPSSSLLLVMVVDGSGVSVFFVFLCFVFMFVVAFVCVTCEFNTMYLGRRLILAVSAVTDPWTLHASAVWASRLAAQWLQG